MLDRIKELFGLFKSDGRYLFALYRYDMKLFKEHSCMNPSNPEVIATKIRLLAHALEKGMSLPNPKAGFGKDKVLALLDMCKKYSAPPLKNIKDTQAVAIAESVISSYIKFQKEHGVDVSFIPEDIQRKCDSNQIKGGTMHIVRDEKFTNFAEIAHKRHSLRYFSETPVSKDEIEKAVALAQTAPSACNRQPIHVYACTKPVGIDAILKLHGGMRGFGKPSVIFAIAGDLTLYQNEYERNTVFVDAGLFGMNLLYALDSCGIASCPIIWGCNPSDDAQMKQILGQPDNHRICLLVAAGYFPSDEYDVATSVRRPLKDVLHLMD